MSETYTTSTTLLPTPITVDVLMKQKEVVVGENLRIQSWFVKSEGKAPYVVQVIGEDADLAAGTSYTGMLRERTQTRLSDGKKFVELQIAAAQAG